jgi:hypothetical protein
VLGQCLDVAYMKPISLQVPVEVIHVVTRSVGKCWSPGRPAEARSGASDYSGSSDSALHPCSAHYSKDLPSHGHREFRTSSFGLTVRNRPLIDCPSRSGSRLRNDRWYMSQSFVRIFKSDSRLLRTPPQDSIWRQGPRPTFSSPDEHSLLGPLL